MSCAEIISVDVDVCGISIKAYGEDCLRGNYYISTRDEKACITLSQREPGGHQRKRRVYKTRISHLQRIAQHYTEKEPNPKRLIIDCSAIDARDALRVANRTGAGGLIIDDVKYDLAGASAIEAALLGVQLTPGRELEKSGEVDWAARLLANEVPHNISLDEAVVKLVSANNALSSTVAANKIALYVEKSTEQFMRGKSDQAELVEHFELDGQGVDRVLSGKDEIIVLEHCTGAGKTEFSEAVAIRHGGYTVYVAPLVSLTHRPFNSLPHYQQRRFFQDGKVVLDPHLGAPNGIRICAPSLPKWPGLIPRVKLLVLDEITQILEQIYTQEGLRNRRSILKSLTDLIEAADYVIVADADMNDRALNYLRSVKRVVRVNPGEAGLKCITATFYSSDEASKRALDNVRAGKATYIATDSKREAEGIAAAALNIKMQCGRAPSVLLITSDTKGNKDVVDFFADPSSADYDVIICSPAVTSGVSLVSERYKTTFVIGKGVVPNKILLQMARRNRVAREIVCGVDSTKREEPSLERLKSKLDLIETEFDRTAALYLHDQAVGRHFQAAGLWHLLESQGATCVRGKRSEEESSAGRSEVLAGIKKAHDEYVRSLLSAEPIQAYKAREIRKSRDMTLEEFNRDERRQIEEAIGTKDIDKEDIVELWRRGRLLSDAERIRIALMTEDEALSLDASESDYAFVDKTRAALQRSAYRKVLESLHISIEDGKILSKKPYSQSDARQAIASLDSDELDVINSLLKNPIRNGRVRAAKRGDAGSWIPTANRILNAMFGFKFKRRNVGGVMCYALDELHTEKLTRTKALARALSKPCADLAA